MFKRSIAAALAMLMLGTMLFPLGVRAAEADQMVTQAVVEVSEQVKANARTVIDYISQYGTGGNNMYDVGFKEITWTTSSLPYCTYEFMWFPEVEQLGFFYVDRSEESSGQVLSICWDTVLTSMVGFGLRELGYEYYTAPEPSVSVSERTAMKEIKAFLESSGVDINSESAGNYRAYIKTDENGSEGRVVGKKAFNNIGQKTTFCLNGTNSDKVLKMIKKATNREISVIQDCSK